MSVHTAGAPPALDQQLLWLAFNMACTLWPAVRTQWLHQVTLPGLVQRLQDEGFRYLATHMPGLADKLAAVQQGGEFRREVERLQMTDVHLVTLEEPTYPPALRWIPDPPPVLYVYGTLQANDTLALAVVGSRKPSPYGQATAQHLSTALARHGFTVVSGLARGIDSTAHHSALQAGGRTVAVLGSGVNVVYPPEHRRLYEAIRTQGAIVSDFPFDTKPDRWNFPRRNRIISGLALGTLVIEASEKSGSLHTARHALEQGREVFAVPGRIDLPSSRGTNNLIKRGAKLVENIEDILEELPQAVRTTLSTQVSPATAPGAPALPADLTADEARVLAALLPEETHIEMVIHASQLPAHVVASILVTLELRGLVRQFPGTFYARC